MSPTASATASATTQETASGPTSNSTAAVSKNMFLQLLVAQIKNQDPLNPADGVQFLTQLAQFTQLEQTVNMSTDLTAIRAALDQLVAQAPAETKS